LKENSVINSSERLPHILTKYIGEFRAYPFLTNLHIPIMKHSLLIKLTVPLVLVLLLIPAVSQAQCEILKSEMKDLKIYMNHVHQLTDSLQIYAESAAYDAYFSKARYNAKKVKNLIGLALTSAEEAVTMVASAQYHSEICGLEAVKTYTIDAENYITDARDFADDAYINVKNAVSAKNLGEMRYYMRKSQNASQGARDSADAAAFAISFAHSSCTHVNRQTVSIDEEE